MHVLVGLLVIVAVGAVLVRFGEPPSTRETVYRICRDSATAQLIAPATAAFPTYEKLEALPGYGFTRDDGSAFELFGYVDSQNAFGAMLRADYLCTVEREGDALVGRAVLVPRN